MTLGAIEVYVSDNIPIRNININLNDIKKIHSILQLQSDLIFNRDSDQYRKDQTVEKSTEEKEADINFYRKRLTTTTTFKMKNGLDHTFYSAEDIKIEKIASQVLVVIIDTTFVSRVETGKPIYPYCKVIIDLSPITVFEPTSFVSAGTSNNSEIIVSGSDRDWCYSTAKQILDAVEAKRNFRSYLHKKGVYDVLLIFIWLPIFVFILYKFNSQLKKLEIDYSLMIIYFAGFTALLLWLNVGRIFFESIRYLWPSVEVKEFVGKIASYRWLLTLAPFTPLITIAKFLL
jgi:hypothetical protein